MYKTNFMPKNHDIIKGLIFYIGHFLISLPA